MEPVFKYIVLAKRQKSGFDGRNHLVKSSIDRALSLVLRAPSPRTANEPKRGLASGKMFYNADILTRKKGTGAFGVIWLAATLGPRSSYKKLSKREVNAVDVPGACAYLQAPPEPMALRLTSSLMVGLSRVLQQQYTFYYNDVQGTYHKLKRSFLSLSEEEINMQMVEAKYDAITLELEDELRLDMEYRPPKTLAAGKKPQPGLQLELVDYDMLMNPELNSLSQDSSLAAAKKRHTLPGVDVFSATRSSFRGGALGDGLDNSTNMDALSAALDLREGSARKSGLGGRAGSKERSLMQNDYFVMEDPLMNDAGFDLFGPDLGDVDFAAMVAEDHADARQNAKKRRRDWKTGAEEEDEDEDKENRNNGQEPGMLDDSVMQHVDSNGFFDTQERQRPLSDIPAGSLPDEKDASSAQENVNKRARKKKKLSLTIRADEVGCTAAAALMHSWFELERQKTDLTNIELLGHIKKYGGDLARFLFDETAFQVMIKVRQLACQSFGHPKMLIVPWPQERKEQQTLELKKLLSDVPAKGEDCGPRRAQSA
ncbi:Rec8 like protein-domain-containing protein [Hyaloraphidium curvatum]|nr:Rec8 like protein-domain-containing protein [Hyaloraphidium curvatum]